jgi:hypothetical protein
MQKIGTLWKNLKENTGHKIVVIPSQQLRYVSTNMFSRCLEAEGSHFEALL